MRSRAAIYAVAAVVLLAVPALPATCPVPAAGHPTIGAALRDAACTSIQLAAGSYAENVEVNRDVTIAGSGSALSTLEGALAVSGSATDLTLSALAVEGVSAGVAGCWPSLLVATGGARVVATDDVVVANSGIANGACRIFTDGFESGGTLAWSASSP